MSLPFHVQKAACLILICACSGRVFGSTFQVYSTANDGDGSLRQAIIKANTNPGQNRIEFTFTGTGPFVIRPTAPLPPLTQPVVLDGTTQASSNGVPLIEIDGSGTSGDGLQVLGGNSEVRGLALTHCSNAGIRIIGPRGTNLIAGNYIGLSPNGVAGGNAVSGIAIYRSAGNTIGGTTATARNVVSGGNGAGIYLTDPAARNNRVIGNYIGVSPDGSRALGNQNQGIFLLGAAANTIGGTETGAGNLISGNGTYGVLIANRTTTGGAPLNCATNNRVVGNYIGTDATGTKALGNTNYGISIQGAANNEVGGETAAARNLVSGNKQYGIQVGLAGSSNNWIHGNWVGLSASGTAGLPNGSNGIVIDAPSNCVGSTNPTGGNVVSGNAQLGVYLGPRSGNCVVEGNLIGTDPSGTIAVGNAQTGLRIESAANFIGGLQPGAGNTISGNTNTGIYIFGPGASNNVIQGNRIGLNRAGTALGNGWSGISVSNAPGTVIGASYTNGRNVISANGDSGILLAGTNATRALVQGNFIGTDITGTRNLGNGDCGIYLVDSGSNTLGSINAGNLVSGNWDGIRLEGSFSRGNLIQANYLGTDVTGQSALGNVEFGLVLTNNSYNTIGGAVPGTGNLISANGGDGIQIAGAGAISNIFQGNLIGTAVDGVSALGNNAHGIEFANGAGKNLVGGSVPEADNHIAFNSQAQGGFDGIRVRSGCIGNFISGNSIFSNNPHGVTNSLGIDFASDGLTPSGVPVLISAASGAQTAVSGSVNASPNTAYRVQFYSSPTTNVAGSGEGRYYAGSLALTTDSKGAANFDATLSITVAPGMYVTATLTDPANTTTEFSRGISVSAGAAGVNATPLSEVVGLPALPSATVQAQIQTTQPALPVVPTPPASSNLTGSGPSTSTFTALSSFTYTEPQLIALRTNGPAANRMNIVFFSEGYTTNELAQFLDDAQRATDGLMSMSPYREYQDYCNVYAIVVPSQHSGASHPQWPLKRNTYFNASYDSTMDYILTMPPNEQDATYANGRGKIDALLQTFMPHCGLPIVLVNEVVAGGSGGGVCITSLGEPFPELMVHESGHTLSHLGDEYTESRDYASSLDSDTEPNTTKEIRRDYIKWKSWIDSATPLPTPPFAQYESTVGLFEGAHYSRSGWYRPKMDCIMRQMDSGAPFCEVCAEAQVKAIYGLVRPIDSVEPAGTLAFVPTNQSRTFAVKPMQPLTHSLSAQWYLDNVAIAGATNLSYELPWSSVVGRSATLSAKVTDPTSYVRNDPQSLLQQTASWTVAPAGFPVGAAIAVQPQNQSVRWSSNAVLTVTAHGSEPLFYQWQYSGVDLPDATNSTLTIPDMQIANAGKYSVVVSNEFARASSTTAVLTITVPVNVAIVGPGSVAPNYDGQWLEFGKSYSMLALPAAKCIFNNWSGSVSTNRPKVTFTPSANMSMTATFTDPVKPTLAITAPTERARLTNATVNIVGTARDNAGLTIVRYRLNGGQWVNAASVNNWTNWNASLQVPAGSNVVEVVGVDTVGNSSVSTTRRFTRVVMQPLNLSTQGLGTVTPNLAGKPLELGQTYTVTATPAKGQLFAGWSTGDRTASLRFQMLSNMVLQASFVTNPFTGLKGVYNGLFESSTTNGLASSGFVKITVTDQGAFTGTFQGPTASVFTGKFWVDGTAQVNLKRAGKIVSLNLSLDLSNHTDQIRGHVTDGTWAADLRCDRAQLSTVAPGLYTLAVINNNEQVSLGDGIGSAKVDTTGTVRLTGTLADGSPITQTTGIAKDGSWPFFASLYTGKGALSGWITFSSNTTESLSGTGLWIKSPAKTGSFRNGFTNAVEFTGSTFQPIKSGSRILALTNASVILSGGGISIPLTNTIVVSSNNMVTVGGGTNNLKLTLGTSTGLISGSFVLPGSRTTTAVRGALMQQTAGARGFFLSGTNSGAFWMESVDQP